MIKIGVNFTCGIKYFPFSCDVLFLTHCYEGESDQATSIFTFADPLFIIFSGEVKETKACRQRTRAYVLVSFNGWHEMRQWKLSNCVYRSFSSSARACSERRRVRTAPGGATQTNPNNHALRAQAHRHRHQLAAGKRPTDQRRRRRRSIDLDDPARAAVSVGASLLLRCVLRPLPRRTSFYLVRACCF